MKRAFLVVCGLVALCIPIGCASAPTGFEPYEAPGFRLAVVEKPGTFLTQQDTKGKVVMVDFFQTWCGPCRQLKPYVSDLHRKYQSKGLVSLAVSPEQPELLAEFHKAFPSPIPMYWDVEGNMNKAFNVDGIPRVVIIGKSGKVVFDEVAPSPKDIQASLEKALGS